MNKVYIKSFNEKQIEFLLELYEYAKTNKACSYECSKCPLDDTQYCNPDILADSYLCNNIPLTVRDILSELNELKVVEVQLEYTNGRTCSCCKLSNIETKTFELSKLISNETIIRQVIETEEYVEVDSTCKVLKIFIGSIYDFSKK